MADDVGVRVAERAALAWNRDAAEDERPPFDQAVQVVAHADASWSGRPRGGAPSCGVEIRGRRDLHVRRIAGDDVDAVTGMLGEHRLVGGLDTAAAASRSSLGDGGHQHGPAERLRRLREKDLVARQRLDNHARTLLLGARDAFDRIADRHCHDRRAVRHGPFDRARDDVGRHERPRGIVHEDDVGVGRHRLERVCHGILPAGAAFDDAHAVEPAWRRARER